jgi:ribosome-binding factor A
MSQGSRPDRVADQLRSELALMLSREVHDPGVGFVTLTRVHVSPDLQQARVMYTVLGDDRSRENTAKALARVASFLRRQIGQRLRLKRAPELRFMYDESVAGQDRIEQLLKDIHVHDAEAAGTAPEPDGEDRGDE